jgi:DNA-binding GntR family transcriptional regulator
MSSAAPQSLDRFPATREDELTPIGLRVRRVIEARIITNALRPGERLSESDLAATLGVSRQPVREALIRLSEASLVRVLPQRGTVVTRISVTHAQSARFLRSAVERAVARAAAPRADAAAIAAMRRIIQDQEAAVTSGDHGLFLALDDALHSAFATSAGHGDAWRMLHNVKLHMDRVRYLSQPDATPASRLLEQHVAIVDAIEARDPDAAEAMMERHLSELLTSLPRLIATLPEYFDDAAVTL